MGFEKQFYYVIPRTGSTSLFNYLHNKIKKDYFYYKKILEDITDEGIPITSESEQHQILSLKKEISSSIANVYFVMAPFGVHDMIKSEVALYTTLRNPIDRVLSLIKFMVKNKDISILNNKVAKLIHSPAKLFSDPQLICLRNEQTRMFSNSLNIDLEHFDLNIAISNLSRFRKVVIFGDFDVYDGFIKKLDPSILNADADATYPKLNSSSDINLSSEELIGFIIKNNSFDIALYDYFNK